MKPFVVLSDMQIPYQDKLTLKAVDNFLEDFQPEEIYYDGDILDFPGLSVYTKEPTDIIHLQDELGEFEDILLKHKKIMPKAKVRHFLAGNHEDRLRRYMLSQAPAFRSLKSLEITNLLHLDKYGVTYSDYDKGVILDGLLKIVHGTVVRKHSGYTAKEMFTKYGMSGISGHTHRLGMYYHRFAGDPSTGAEDRHYVWGENGCLCSLTPTYLDAPDWTQGFTVGWILEDHNHKKRFQLEQIPIIHHKFIFGGKLYRP